MFNVNMIQLVLICNYLRIIALKTGLFDIIGRFPIIKYITAIVINLKNTA